MRRGLVLALTALALAGCGGAPATNAPATNAPTAAAAAEATTPPEPTAAPTAAPEPTAEPTAVPAEPGTSRSAPISVGTELSFKDWAITITGVTRGADAADALIKANKFNDPAPEGFAYILADVKVTNISTDPKAQDPSFGVDVRITGSRNLLYPRVAAVTPKPLEGDLLPKGSAEGQIAFLAPSDEKNLMFRVGELLTFDDSGYRYVAIDEGASVSPPGDLPTATEVGATRESPAKLNEPVATDKYEVTVLEVLRGDEAAAKVQEGNKFNDPAPDGQAYIAVRVKVRAGVDKTPDSITLIDSNWFKVSGEKNVVYDRPSVVAPAPALDASLYAGGEAEGWVVVSAPPDEKGLVLNIEPLFSFSESNARYVSLE